MEYNYCIIWNKFWLKKAKEISNYQNQNWQKSTSTPVFLMYIVTGSSQLTNCFTKSGACCQLFGNQNRIPLRTICRSHFMSHIYIFYNKEHFTGIKSCSKCDKEVIQQTTAWKKVGKRTKKKWGKTHNEKMQRMGKNSRQIEFRFVRERYILMRMRTFLDGFSLGFCHVMVYPIIHFLGKFW
jgi:hypothetical protein